MSWPPLPRPEHDFGPGPVGKPTPLHPRDTIDSGDLRELVLYRVGGFRQEWFDEREDEALGQTVATKRVARAVEEMLAQDCHLVTVQRLDL